MKNHFVYKITHNASGKVYVGQTCDLERRWKEHCKPAVINTGCNKHYSSLVRNAILKHGKENFTFEALETCTSDLVDEREIHHIKEQDCLSPKGYCLLQGGGGTTLGHHEESRRKMSLAHTGKVLTAATRAKMSKSRMGALNPAYGGQGTYCVPIARYSADGVYIDKFISAAQAVKVLDVTATYAGTHVAAASKTKSSAYGYYWVQSKTSEFPDRVEYHSRPNHLVRRVVIGTDAQGVETEYPSMNAAAAAVGVSASNICACVTSGRGTAGGCTWRYKDTVDDGVRYIATDVLTGATETYRTVVDGARATKTSGHRIRMCLDNAKLTATGRSWRKDVVEVPQ